MKNLKHLIALVMALALMLCLCACTNGGDDGTSEPAGSSAATEHSKSTESSESTEASVSDPVEPTYRVKVVDQGGNAMAGVMVQLCLDQCSPAVTNGEGVAEFYLDEADYHVSILQMPQGYGYATEKTEFYFADGSNELTITLVQVPVD